MAVTYHLMPFRMVIIKKTKKQMLKKNMEKRKFKYLVGGNIQLPWRKYGRTQGSQNKILTKRLRVSTLLTQTHCIHVLYYHRVLQNYAVTVLIKITKILKMTMQNTLILSLYTVDMYQIVKYVP